MKTNNVFLLVTLLLGMIATTSRAEETAPVRDYDRFDLRVGGGWVFGADTAVSLIGQRGVGTVIDYDKTLDGQTSNSLFRIDGTWNINKRNSLNYTWYDVNRTGMQTIDRDIDSGDQTFPVGATINSQLDIKLNRLLYRYGLARTDQINFDIGGGIYYANISMTMSAVGNIGALDAGASKAVSLQAPMPTAGVNLECKLSKRWSTTFSADWFYFAYDNWQGAQTDIQIGLAYKIAKNWTLGAAYDRFTIIGRPRKKQFDL